MHRHLPAGPRHLHRTASAGRWETWDRNGHTLECGRARSHAGEMSAQRAVDPDVPRTGCFVRKRDQYRPLTIDRWPRLRLAQNAKPRRYVAAKVGILRVMEDGSSTIRCGLLSSST
jgi:hypothetical protein